VLRLSKRAEAIILAAFDRECFGPVAVQALARIGLDDEAAVAVRAAVGTSRKLRAKFLARRRGLPTLGDILGRGSAAVPSRNFFGFPGARTFLAEALPGTPQPPKHCENKTEREKNSFHKQN
jgi:hypothetical protein